MTRIFPSSRIKAQSIDSATADHVNALLNLVDMGQLPAKFPGNRIQLKCQNPGAIEQGHAHSVLTFRTSDINDQAVILLL